MTPIASAAAAQYQTVFDVVTIPLGTAVLVLLGAGVMFAVGVGIGIDAVKSSLADKVAMVLCIAAVPTFIAGVILMWNHTDQTHALRAHLSSDLQQKYGVTLNENSDYPATDDALAKPFTYTVDLPDGATGQYSIRFDRNTSEPFAVPTPTLDQLEQNAKK